MRKMSLIGMMLIAIIIYPNYIGIPLSLELQPRLIDSQVSRTVKTIEAMGMSIPSVITTRIEEWSNGTKFHMIFYHLLDANSEMGCLKAPEEIDFSKPREYYGTNSTPSREVIVTYTKWITNSSAATPKETSQANQALTNLLETGVYYPYTSLIDTLQFVLKGRFGNVFVSYDHNDNYNSEVNGGVYPLEANTPYILKGSQKPYHVHLTKDLLDGWVVGNLTAALVVGATFLASYVIGELIEKGLAAVSSTIAAILAAPVVVVILAIIDIAEALKALLEMLGFINEAQWVENVIREHFLGDGWAWRGPIYGREFVGWVWCPFWTRPITGWGIYQYREFEQTWGSEGIFNPNTHKCSICWYDRTEWLSASTPATIK